MRQQIAARMLREKEGMEYCAMCRNSFRDWAEKIGARVNIGRSVRYDRAVIDRALDEKLAASEGAEE